MHALTKIRGGLMGLLAILIWASTGLATVPTTISFQGNLTDSLGTPVADGDYTMRFFLFNTVSGGSQLWNAPSGEEQVVAVADGVYNVLLGAVHPLTPSVFSSGTAWLEVMVNGEILVPRMRISATAYALKSGNTDTLQGKPASDFAGTGHEHDAEYVNAGEAGGVSSAMIAPGAVSSGTVADNSLNGADIADGSLTANDIADGSDSGLDADLLDGLNGSAYTLITADYGRSGVAATLYEGASTLTAKYVNENQANSISGSMITDSTITALDLAPGSVGASEISSNAVSTNTISFPLDYTGTDLNGAPVAIINTSNGTAGNWPAGLVGVASGSPGSTRTIGVYGAAPSFTTSARELIPAASSAGVAGASDTGYGVVGASTSHAHAAVYGESSRGYGIYGKHTDASYTSPGVYGKNEGSGVGVLGDAYSSGSAGIHGRGYNGASAGRFDGNVDITGGTLTVNNDVLLKNGTTTAALFDVSTYGLTLYSATGQKTFYLDSESGAYVTMNERDGTQTIYIDAESGTEGGPFMYMYNNTGTATVYIDGDADDAGYMYLRDASGTATISLDADYNGTGRITTQELHITGGSDLSEQFDIQHPGTELTPGMVVSIDPGNPGKLEISRTSYDNKVAGIISGANGIKPGMIMGQAGTDADGKYAVALTGRVYCRANASSGPILPGDLLTTSDVPGHAMKVNDYPRANGAILGKAMTRLDSGSGMVLVLVSLQ